jgi:hypothetical protein
MVIMSREASELLDTLKVIAYNRGMVKREQHSIDKQALCALIESAELVRAENGVWSLAFTLDGEIPIGDGRGVLFSKREVRAQGSQTGRKPRTVKAFERKERKRQ